MMGNTSATTNIQGNQKSRGQIKKNQIIRDISLRRRRGASIGDIKNPTEDSRN